MKRKELHIRGISQTDSETSLMTIIIVLVVALTLFGCKKTEQANCTCPPTICLQPLDNYTQKEAKQLSMVLEKKFMELYGVKFEFEVLPNKKLSAELMNDAKTRYRADKIINFLKGEAGDHRFIIGLSHKDVSVPYKGKADWGVLGLSIHGTYACVVSDYRLKNKRRDYWKVATHEFTHTACNYSHCPEDNPHCIMQDAKGHANFSKKEGFCKTCKENINIYAFNSKSFRTRTVMEILLGLANYYQLCRGEFQWRTIAWLSIGIVLFSLFWQIRLGRKGLTPARSMLTLMSVGYPVIVYLSKDLFDFLTIESDSFFLLLIPTHLIIMILLKWVYDVGRMSLRKVLCFFYPLLFIGGFLMILFAYFLLGSEFAKRENNRFDALSQKEKNEYYTREQLCERTNIADWPKFDVQKFHHHVCGPDEDYEIVLRFRQSLTKPQIRNLEKLCDRGKWHRRDDGYRMVGTDKQEEAYNMGGYGVFVHPKERTLVIKNGSY